MIRKGMVFCTNYSPRVYKAVEVRHGCTCPSYLDTLNNTGVTSSPEHCHIMATCLTDKGHFYFNGYTEDLHSVWSNDFLIDLDMLPIILLL